MLIISEKDKTTQVEPFNSSHLGHETFFISTETSEKNFLILFIQKANMTTNRRSDRT